MNDETKKQVLRKLTYGMWVLTTGEGDELEGSSVTWVTQSSFSPPLVTFCLRADSRLAALVEKHKIAALHLLTKSQKALAESFTKPTQVADGKIGGVAFKPSAVTKAPILDGFAAWFEVRVTDTVKRGDHTVFVAEVVEVGVTDASAEPLVLAEVGWSYGG